MLPTRTLGNTGIRTSILALGGRQLADPGRSDAEIQAVVDRALDLGVSLIDTAPAFAAAQSWVGKALQQGRRLQVSAKVGQGVPGVMDWTPECITAGIDQALQATGAEVIDIAYLHACSADTLQKNGVVEALQRAVEAGNVRASGYAGEGEGLDWAVRSGAFGVVQSSVNCCDPMAGRTVLRRAAARGMGVVAKRPLANAPWAQRDRPNDPAAKEYRRRWQAMALQVDMAPQELALRWTAYHPAVHVSVAGMTTVAQLEENVAAVARGPLPRHVIALVDAAHRQSADGWAGQL